MDNKKIIKAIIIALCSTSFTILICLSGLSFLIVKECSPSFIPDTYMGKMSDYYTSFYAKLNQGSTDDKDIVIIDITECDRNDIANLIIQLEQLYPRVIGLDAVFRIANNDKTDSLLVSTLNAYDNIVLPIEITSTSSLSNGNDLFYGCFKDNLKSSKYGIATMKGMDDARYYMPFVSSNDTVSIPTFAYKIASEYNPQQITLQDNKKLLINYTTLSLKDDDAINAKQLIDATGEEIKWLNEEIQDKIILIGAFKSTDDLHPTPMGYCLPGVLINAHIISMLVHDKTIRSFPKTIFYIICFIVSFLISFYFHDKKSSTPLRKFVRLICVTGLVLVLTVLCILIGTFLFCKYSFYIDFTPLVVVYLITLAVRKIDFTYAINKVKSHLRLFVAIFVLSTSSFLSFGQNRSDYSIYNVSSDIVLTYNKDSVNIKSPIRGTSVCLNDKILFKGNGSYVSIRDNQSCQIYKVRYTGTSQRQFTIKEVLDASKASVCPRFILLLQKICKDYGLNVNGESVSNLFVYKGDNMIPKESEESIQFRSEGICDQIKVSKIEDVDNGTFHYSISNSSQTDFYITIYAISPDNTLYSYKDVFTETSNGLRNDKILFIPCPHEKEIKLDYINLPMDYNYAVYFNAISSKEITSKEDLWLFCNQYGTSELKYIGNDIVITRFSIIRSN